MRLPVRLTAALTIESTMGTHKRIADDAGTGPESRLSVVTTADPSLKTNDEDPQIAEFEEKLQQTLHAFKLRAAREVVRDLPKITAKVVERSAASLEALAGSSEEKLRAALTAAQTELNERYRKDAASISEETAKSLEFRLKESVEAANAEIARSATDQIQALNERVENAVRSVETASEDAAARLASAWDGRESSSRAGHEKQLAELAAASQGAGGALERIESAASAAEDKLRSAREQIEKSLLSALEEKLASVSAERAADFDRRTQAGLTAAREQLEGELSEFKRKAAARIQDDLSKTSTGLLEDSAGRLRRQTDEARAGLLAELQSSGAAVLEQTRQELADFQRESSRIVNQSAKAAAEKAVSEAARAVEEQARTAIQHDADQAIERIDAERQKLHERTEANLAAHQKKLLQLSTEGIESVQRQLDAQLEISRNQLKASLHALEQKAIEKAAADFPAAASDLLEDASARLKKQAMEAVADVKETLQASTATLAGEVRSLAVDQARDSLREMRETAIEQARNQLTQWVKESAAGRRQEFEAEVEGAIRKQKRAIQHQVDETFRAGLERLQQASTNIASAPAAREQSPLSRWALVFVALIPTVLFLYLMNRPVMRLKSAPPPEFVNAYPEWTGQHQNIAVKLGQAYWDWAALHLQRDYPYGADLPEQPPVSFEVEGPGFPDGVEADVARTRYWNKLRELWKNPSAWDKIDAWNRR